MSGNDMEKMSSLIILIGVLIIPDDVLGDQRVEIYSYLHDCFLFQYGSYPSSCHITLILHVVHRFDSTLWSTHGTTPTRLRSCCERHSLLRLFVLGLQREGYVHNRSNYLSWWKSFQLCWQMTNAIEVVLENDVSSSFDQRWWWQDHPTFCPPSPDITGAETKLIFIIWTKPNSITAELLRLAWLIRFTACAD